MAEIPPKTPDPRAAAASEMAHFEKEVGGTGAVAGAKAAEPASGHGEAVAKPVKKGTKKKKKAEAQGGVSLSMRLKTAGKFFATQSVEIFRGLFSSDRLTRRMSLFFFASLVGAVAVSGVVVKHFTRHPQAESEKDLLAGGEGESAVGHGLNHSAEAEAKHSFSMADLGPFTVELKPIPGHRIVPGIVNMAEITLIVECDSHETSSWIEEHLPQARDEVTHVFLAIDREELLSRDGKRKLKKALLDRLNVWLPNGRLSNVFFSKLIVP